LPTPSIHPVTIRVEDENGKFLAGSTPATLNKVEDKEETAE